MSESKSKPESRRQFLKYGAAVVVAAAAGAAGYSLYQSSQAPPAPTTVVPTTYTTTAASSVMAKPIEIWWVTEFFPEEQLAFLEIANSYTTLTGTPVHVTFYDFKAAEAKLLTAVKTGEVPDISNDIGIAIGNRLAAQGGLADVSDVIADLKKTGDYVPVAEEMASVYNAVAKSRSYYQVPQALQPFVNVYWHDVFKKYTGMDAPPTDWDGWWGAFKQAQDKGAMKDLGMYAFALSIFSPGGDSEDAFSTLLYAHGANPLTADGKVNYGDPAFKKAVGDAVHFIVDLYQKGYIPSGSTAGDDSWNNVVIESKKGLMCYANGSLSIPAWFRSHDPDNYKNNIYWADFPTTGPSGNTYNESVIGGTVSFIMKDGKNIEGAKDFIRYFMKPENYDNWFVGYQYRYLPVLKSSLDTLPMYTDPNDHIVPKSKSYLDRATVDFRYVNNTWSNASYGEHVLSNMATSVLTKNMSEADAVNAAFARLEELSKQAGE
jgi:multiple sugar transport system substrate-binding protein